MISSKLAAPRSWFLPFAAFSLLFVVAPAAHAQVPQAQTGGSGQSDADTPPPAPADDKATDAKPADSTKSADDAAKPADGTVATTPAATDAAKPAATPASANSSSSGTAAKKHSKIPLKDKLTKSDADSKKKPEIIKTKDAPAKKGPSDANGGAEPDKVLYDRANDDLKHGRYTEGRLALQTLVNTYPDSEYLAKAKLMVADSFYKEGGTGNMTQAIQEYKDFQTFFPFLENEASYAQMQVGLAHYHMMEKSDRDTTQAQQAEDEFQAFLIKYPQSPLVPKAQQYLRDTQEVLADGEFKIAYYYYYTKQDYRASAARLVELSDRYPLYSQNDQALWMLGDIYDRARQISKNEDDKNHWADLASKCYDRIVTEYPLSKEAGEAADRLKAMNKPVPAANPDAKAREEQQLAYERDHKQNKLVQNGMGMIKGNPDTTMAARYGTPQMAPPDDAVSATEVLKPGAAGPSFAVTGSGGGRGAEDSGTGGTDVKVEDATSVGHTVDPNADAQTGVGAEIITPVNDRFQPTSETPGQPKAEAPATTAPPAATPSTLDSNAGAAGAGSAAAATGTPGAATSNAPANATTESSSGTPAGAGTTSSSSSQQAPAESTASPDANSAKASSAADSSGESTSKKKKGVKKIMPWSKGQ
jgi:outer membrane protein assembly factor BamD